MTERTKLHESLQQQKAFLEFPTFSLLYSYKSYWSLQQIVLYDRVLTTTQDDAPLLQ